MPSHRDQLIITAMFVCSFILIMFSGPLLYIINVKRTHAINGLFVFYSRKSSVCKQMLDDIQHLKFVTFIDIAPVPSLCITKDTGKALSDTFNSGRINAGSALVVAQAQYNAMLASLSYDNELPLFVKMCNGNVADRAVGYPNKWFNKR